MELRADIVEFLKDEMCVDVEDLHRTINASSVSMHTGEICKCIAAYFDALSMAQAEEEIQKTFLSFEHLYSNESLYGILDTLRHAFDGIAYGGLHQLYIRQENQGWYPKVKLVRELKPNDIESLNETVTVYRGCSNLEHMQRCYGQSWSTSMNVAEKFAYTHYQGQSWFNASHRIILKANISKKSIFYSSQTELGEFEVAVNTQQLCNIEVCT